MAEVTTRDDLLGLVRALDPGAARHVYGVGSAPSGHLVGELGSIHAEPGPGRVAVHLTRDGRLTTDAYQPAAARPRPLKTARWIAAPLSWRGFATVPARLRGAAWRVRVLPDILLRSRKSATAGEARGVGWIDREPGPRSVPLFSTVHPVTGDQLLTTNPPDATDLGYVDAELLGFLDGSAPVTGRRRLERPHLRWASRFGQRPRSGPELLEDTPRGDFTGPGDQPVAPPFVVGGWALAPDSSIAAIEIFVDHRPVGGARLGLPRPDIAGATGHVDGPICGFEHVVGSGVLPDAATPVTVTAIARDFLGRTFEVGETTVAIREESVPPQDLPRGDELRRRAREVCRRTTSEPGETNVLVATHRLDVGGAQLWLHEVLERLARHPSTSLTLVSAIDGPLREPLEALGIRVHVSDVHPLHGVDTYEGRVAELAAWAAPQGFNVALVNALRSFPALDVADRLGIPSVMALHESFDLETWWLTAYAPGAVHPYVKERAREALAGASAVIFEADATRRLWATDGDAARFLTVPYAIELERIDRFRSGFDRAEARSRLGLAATSTVVLCLGLIEPRKAQVCLAQAFHAIADRHPEATLALVGESAAPHMASHNVALREYLQRAGLESRARVVPMTDEPYEWHGVADLLVSSSDVESLPRVVLEAMAFEVPVLATRIFGLPELIDDERTGWLCEPRDVASLADGLERALTSPRRDEIRRAATEVVRARHEPEAYAARLASLLEGLAADPAADARALVA